MINQADLPCTIDGTVPDILFNGHGIPSHTGELLGISSSVF